MHCLKQPQCIIIGKMYLTSWNTISTQRYRMHKYLFNNDILWKAKVIHATISKSLGPLLIVTKII